MRSYGQFCPIARTSELLAERWTPLIVRNLLNGCRTFTEVRQGAPGIPTALLAKRLAALERHGIIESEPKPATRGRSFRLTEKGRDLQDVCDAMGRWGARWLEIEPHHLEPAYVLWATSKLVDESALPARAVVVRFDLRDRPAEQYWLILKKPPELCTRGVGYVEDIIVQTDSGCIVDIHLRRTSHLDAIRDGRLVLTGPTALTREFWTWLRPSPFATAG